MTATSAPARRGKAVLGAVLAGVVFGVGLVVSGMARPSKVLAFLTLSKDWDPSLLFVMAGAIGVHALSYRVARRREAPVAAETFQIPPARGVDSRLVIGAAVFGVGWGLSGFCPGPSLVALPTAAPGTVAFVLAFVVGSFVGGKLSGSSSPTAPEDAKSLTPSRSVT